MIIGVGSGQFYVDAWDDDESEFPEPSGVSHAAGILFARLVPRHTEAGTVGRILS